MEELTKGRNVQLPAVHVYSQRGVRGAVFRDIIPGRLPITFNSDNLGVGPLAIKRNTSQTFRIAALPQFTWSHNRFVADI